MALVALVSSTPGGARACADEAPQRTRRVVAGERYAAGGFYQWLFGHDYRELWTTPVELPVLDLQTFAGGLRPVRRVGHGQSQGLAMVGADGQSYTFRPVLKDPSGLLPIELRQTFASRLVKDQMASGHPAGHVIVPVLLDAAGVLHNTPRLVVMPDDPALGEFRGDFAGVVGDIEEYAGQQGFAGAEAILDGEQMWERLQAGPDVRVDSRAYLVARLVDQLIGDWDRHRNQWSWARMPGEERWRPIPEDRDQAFVRFEGFALTFLRPQLPLLVAFGPEYPSLDGLTFDGWDVDRRLLADLEEPVWTETAAWLQGRITDEVIERAARQMPAEYFAKDGPRLIAALKARRDALAEQAERFYRFLADQVDVHGTDQAERLEVERDSDGTVEVSMAVEGPDARPYFHRRFDPRDTSEVRVYLHGGDDHVVTRGARSGAITVRVVGGPGGDTVDTSAGGGVRFYDALGANSVAEGPGSSWDHKPYTQPPPSPSADWIPARDWGRRTIFPILRITGSSDIGLFGSVGMTTTGWGFRKYPFADRQSVRAGFATRENAPRAEYLGQFHFENARLWGELHARASGIDILRFHGFGNETSTGDQPDDYFQVQQDQFVLEPLLHIPLGERFDLHFGPVVKYAITEHGEDTFIEVSQPYGAGDFGQLGAQAHVRLDTTDRPGLPQSGVQFEAGGSAYPAAWDVDSAFGEVHGEATAFLTGGTAIEPTLAVRVGGKRVWGTYPFQEAAFLGGASTPDVVGGGGSAVRGLRPQRYAGDAALFGSVELRLTLAQAFLFVPGQFGVVGLADAGRVYLDGESSNRWHRGFGGGLWFSSPQRRNAVSVLFARSEGRTAFYVRTGFAF